MEACLCTEGNHLSEAKIILHLFASSYSSDFHFASAGPASGCFVLSGVMALFLHHK